MAAIVRIFMSSPRCARDDASELAGRILASLVVVFGHASPGAGDRCVITVILPVVLNRPELSGDVIVHEPAATIGDLVGVLDARYPGLAAEIDDALFNFAVNGRLVLHRVRQEPLSDGDVVEILPTSF
jgi:molybdopterin converting factor small subunit